MTHRHCVVLAGGLGTRVESITRGLIPKCLIPIDGRAFLDYKLETLRSQGFTDIFILIGQLGNLVSQHLARTARSDMRVSAHSDGPVLRGTGGSILSLLPTLPQRFWVTYADSLTFVEPHRVEEFSDQFGNLSVMTTYRNRDAIEPSNVSVASHRVTRYDKSKLPGKYEWIDYGMLLLTRDAFEPFVGRTTMDLHEVLVRLVESSQLLAYEAPHRYWDIGTPEAIAETIRFVKSVKWGHPE